VKLELRECLSLIDSKKSLLAATVVSKFTICMVDVSILKLSLWEQSEVMEVVVMTATNMSTLLVEEWKRKTLSDHLCLAKAFKAGMMEVLSM
jgi:hypothetical protein